MIIPAKFISVYLIDKNQLIPYNNTKLHNIFKLLNPLKVVHTKILNEVLQSINGGTLIQKVITDLNKSKTHYAKKTTCEDISIGIALFVNDDILRAHYFGKTGKSFETLNRSQVKGLKLIKSPKHIFRSIGIMPSEDGEKSLGGALKANGVVISVSGFRDEMKNEYLAWLILNSAERRFNELNMSLGDTRFKDIENKYVIKEKERLAEFNIIQ